MKQVNGCPDEVFFLALIRFQVLSLKYFSIFNNKQELLILK